jgi:hypothetical protein
VFAGAPAASCAVAVKADISAAKKEATDNHVIDRRFRSNHGHEHVEPIPILCAAFATPMVLSRRCAICKKPIYGV